MRKKKIFIKICNFIFKKKKTQSKSSNVEKEIESLYVKKKIKNKKKI